MMDFNVKIVRRDARNPIANILSTRGLDSEDHVFVRAVTNRSEETSELGLDEATIECELTTLKGLRGRKRRLCFSGRACLLRFDFVRTGIGKPEASRMLRMLRPLAL